MIASEIVVAPMGGLCNRMQALSSAVRLAEQTDAKLTVHWYRSPNINIALEDLFLVPDRIDRVVEFDLYKWPGRFKRKLYRKYYQRFFDRYLEFSSLMPDATEIERRVHGVRAFITAYRCFYESGDVLSGLQSVPRLGAVIESGWTASNNTVGVHVRRTDHAGAVNHSPLEAFVALMQQEIDRDPDTGFFLATDSPAVETELSGKFPDRILIYPKRSLDRNDQDAIEDAVVDLYRLSKCRKVIGSYDSSFSETAAKLGGVPLVTALSKKG